MGARINTAAQDAVPPSRLREALAYCPTTGRLTNKIKRYRSKVGDEPGYKGFFGYRQISVDGRSFHAHRVAWAIHYGEWPALFLDHINGDRSDNRIANLRQCTYAENHQNVKSHRGARSKYVGVDLHKGTGKWRARICRLGVVTDLGLFSEEIDAYAAYCKAKAELHTFNPTPRRANGRVDHSLPRLG